MGKNIKILHIWWSGGVGGAERFIKDIVVYSDGIKYDNRVCFLSKRGRYAEEIEKNGGQVYCLNMRNGMDLFRFMGIFKVLNEASPDIILAHGETAYLNILLPFLKRPNKIFFEHGGNLKSNRASWFYKIYARSYDLILANSYCTKNAILDYSRNLSNKVKVFYIGINLSDYEAAADVKNLQMSIGVGSGMKVVGMVGRLVEQKGVDDFIKTASYLDSLFRGKYAFVVVGGGPLRLSLEQQSHNLNVPVVFLGERSDVPELLKTFDVFLFTSKWEPFGITLLEALSSGVPVAGFATGGAIEIIEKGGGIFIKDRSHKMLANTVVRLLDDPSLYGKLAKEGKENVAKYFNVFGSIKNLELIFKELVCSNEDS